MTTQLEGLLRLIGTGMPIDDSADNSKSDVNRPDTGTMLGGLRSATTGDPLHDMFGDAWTQIGPIILRTVTWLIIAEKLARYPMLAIILLKFVMATDQRPWLYLASCDLSGHAK